MSRLDDLYRERYGLTPRIYLRAHDDVWNRARKVAMTMAAAAGTDWAVLPDALRDELHRLAQDLTTRTFTGTETRNDA